MKKAHNIKTIKTEKPRKNFAERLADKLRESKLGEVTLNNDMEGDDVWVELKIGKILFSFELDKKGQSFERIGLFQEIWECVDQQQIFAVSIRKQSTDKPTTSTADNGIRFTC